MRYASGMHHLTKPVQIFCGAQAAGVVPQKAIKVGRRGPVCSGFFFGFTFT